MQPHLWFGSGHVFDGSPIVGRASENCGRIIGLRADLLAQPLHFYVFERLGGEAVGDFWVGRRVADADDNSVDRICPGGVAVFAINGLSGVDGSPAPDILVYCDDVRLEISRRGLFSFQGPVFGGLIYVDYHIHSGSRPNDHCTEADSREVGHILSDAEEIFPVTLE